MRLEYFQLLTRVTELDLKGLTIRAEADIPAASTIFEGHFPGHPLMPGVLLVETMAQASGWLAMAQMGFSRMPFLAAVKEAKLRTFVIPGQRLNVQSTIAHEGSGYMVCSAEIRAGGKLVCDAELTLRVMPFPNESFRSSMREVAERIQLPMETATHV